MKPGVFDKGVEVFEVLSKSEKFWTYSMRDVVHDVGLPVAISHGDLWANNLMWKMNSDGSRSNELGAIIDWQMIHEGSMANDLARFFSICVDGEVRREHEYKVLQYFYETIKSFMNEEGKNIGFTYEQLKKAYRVNFANQALTLMMMAPLQFAESEWTPEEAPIKKAQLEKVLLRAQFAMEDALVYIEEIPREKIFPDL
uniref:CHK domain-containing protein n=1 Tax=Steinernema glaseri TaxID=37863 RepID=A0A1I7YPV8_9BILA